VEFFQQLATTQYMKHLRLQALATAPLRDLRAMLQRDGAFNTLAHTAQMRRPENGAGRYNIPNIGIFVWRLLSLPLTQIPLTPDPADASKRKFRVNPLGADLHLFRHAQTEDDVNTLAEPINVPAPLSVRMMALDVQRAQASATPDAHLDDDYGPGNSVVLLAPAAAPGADPQPLSVTKIRICDLRDILDAGGNVIAWNHQDAVPAGTIGIDPERGRVLLGSAADGPLLASFHYGSVRAIGGGEYEREPAGADMLDAPIQVSGGAALQPGLSAIAGGGRLYIGDSLTYAETPVFKVNPVLAEGAAGLSVVVSAINSARPLLAASGEVSLQLGARGQLIIEGLVISGGALHLPLTADDEPRELILRDCTLVPGRTLHPDGSAVSPGVPSLIVDHPFASVTLERCITGPIRAVADARINLVDCIVDAGAPDAIAYDADGAGNPGAELKTSNCTVIGKLHTRLARLLENSIFFARLTAAPGETWHAPVLAERRQEGCVRFCYVPTGSITPRRYRCVPDKQHPTVLPHFSSLRYGDAAYAQLRSATDAAIREGAEDGSEMGVLRPLYQPQRETNLRIRLDEYLRFGLRAGLFYAT
jgi:hypothetical protein